MFVLGCMQESSHSFFVVVLFKSGSRGYAWRYARACFVIPHVYVGYLLSSSVFRRNCLLLPLLVGPIHDFDRASFISALEAGRPPPSSAAWETPLPSASVRLIIDGEHAEEGRVSTAMPLPLPPAEAPGSSPPTPLGPGAETLSDVLLLGPDFVGRMSEVRKNVRPVVCVRVWLDSSRQASPYFSGLTLFLFFAGPLVGQTPYARGGGGRQGLPP